MITTIKNMFEKKVDNAYRRINPFHPIDIYLGYNIHGEKSLVIVEQSNCKRVTSSKIIDVTLEKRLDNKLKLNFVLKDDFFEELFYKFCEDIIIFSQELKKTQAINKIIERWDSWKIMFKNPSREILPDNIIKGLIGELYILKYKLAPKLGYKKALKAWDGPLGGHKDFVYDDTWIEVKTCILSSDIVKINSIEQLDSENEGYLNIVRMDRTNSQNKNSITLNSIVEEVKQIILDSETLELYYKKLSNLNYNYNVLYDEKCFEIENTEEYRVNKTFPKISRKNIPEQIQFVQYDLSISNLKGWSIV